MEEYWCVCLPRLGQDCEDDKDFFLVTFYLSLDFFHIHFPFLSSKRLDVRSHWLKRFSIPGSFFHFQRHLKEGMIVFFDIEVSDILILYSESSWLWWDSCGEHTSLWGLLILSNTSTNSISEPVVCFCRQYRGCQMLKKFRTSLKDSLEI